MLDLLGDPYYTNPAMASLINPQHGFIDWWSSYPKSTRKVAKPQCLAKWVKLSCASESSHVIGHTEWMKTQADWLKENGAFICAPLVYLNQQRWADWNAAEVVRKPERDPELVKLDADKKNRAAPSLETLAAIAKIKQGVAK